MGVEKYRTSQGTFWKVDLELTAADGRVVRFRKRKVPTREMAEALASKMRIEAFEGRFFDRPAHIGNNPTSFEPQGMKVTERRADGTWTDPDWFYLPGFILCAGLAPGREGSGV